jgi:hypothetical protein
LHWRVRPAESPLVENCAVRYAGWEFVLNVALRLMEDHTGVPARCCAGPAWK